MELESKQEIIVKLISNNQIWTRRSLSYAKVILSLVSCPRPTHTLSPQFTEKNYFFGVD